jgi:hypothetical protein
VYALGIGLLILALVVLVLLVVEIRQYAAGRRLISRRRFATRVLAGLLMLLLLAAVFQGLFNKPWDLGLRSAYDRPQLFLGYWLACILVAVALVWVMLADMQEVEDRFSSRQHQLWRDMARFIADNMTGEGRKHSGPKGDGKE